MRKILLVLAGWFHPPFQGRVELKQALAELPQCSFDEVSSLAEAARRRLSDYDALVLYYHHRDTALSADDLEAFKSYVHGGGGVLAVHSATASYKPTREYFAVLGGRFVGHGPVAPMEVRPARDDDPIFGGIGNFSVRDELYLHELQPDIEPRFVSDHEGKPAPVVWTRTAGNGRVCYVNFGHRAEPLRHPAVREILRRGLEWSLGARV
jgi:type 1 glutamine amidotransferase